jgi:hypothetical protein
MTLKNKLINNYQKSIIELADYFLEEYFGSKTCYTDPNSYARFVGDEIGGILDCGSDIAFLTMEDVLSILELEPEKDAPYTYCLELLGRDGKNISFRDFYKNIYTKGLKAF